MADKMMRNAVRGPDGKAKAMQGDLKGNLYANYAPLEFESLIDEPLILEGGKNKSFPIFNGAKTYSLLGVINKSDGMIEIAFSNRFEGTSQTHEYKINNIINYRFESEVHVSKSKQITVSVRNPNPESVTIEGLYVVENVFYNQNRNIKYYNLLSKIFNFNDIFELNGTEITGTKQHREAILTNKYKKLLVYIDSNYDVPFDVNIYDYLLKKPLFGEASFDGNKFVFISDEDRRDYVELPAVNENIESLPRHVRFPIHEAINKLNNGAERIQIRLRAKEYSSVSVSKRNDLSLRINVIGVI